MTFIEPIQDDQASEVVQGFFESDRERLGYVANYTRAFAHRPDVYAEPLANAPKGFEVACTVPVIVGDDAESALEIIKWSLAFYIGGMGAPSQNFHLNVIGRMGFEEEAAHVQKLFLEGRREDAVKAVPDALADEISLAGPPARIAERLQAWVDSPVTQLLVGARDPAILRLLADALG